MGSVSGSKLNLLLKKWPPGTVAVLPWLKKQGVYQQLAYKYEQSAWLKRIGEGAYIRDGETVRWTGGVYALQSQLGLPVHVGGKTALEMKGFSHFLSPRGKAPVYLFSESTTTKLPTWFVSHKWEVRVFHKMPKLFSPSSGKLGITTMPIEHYELLVSSPERAIIEVLYLVPQEQSFAEARLLMESLTTLRPDIAQSLLERCRSIKAKRLFLYLAEQTEQRWFGKIRTSRTNLGKGKRLIAKGGVFNAKYQITVPKPDEGEKEGGPEL